MPEDEREKKQLKDELNKYKNALTEKENLYNSVKSQNEHYLKVREVERLLKENKVIPEKIEAATILMTHPDTYKIELLEDSIEKIKIVGYPTLKQFMNDFKKKFPEYFSDYNKSYKIVQNDVETPGSKSSIPTTRDGMDREQFGNFLLGNVKKK